MLAAEPLCVCGIDVAAPLQLRRGCKTGLPRVCDYVQQFKRQLTPAEVAFVLGAGTEGARCAAGDMAVCSTVDTSRSLAAAQKDAFQKVWSLKEALVKARGDGLAYELGHAEFCVRGDTATVCLDGVPQAHWCGFVFAHCPGEVCHAPR